ncbi:MAG: NAD(P)H-dependent oxidoreductase subunit E [Candidatus Omnitrophota bacterium]
MSRLCAVERKVTKDGRVVTVCDETRSRLLPILQEVQDKKGCIGDKDMQEIADRLGIHPVEVYSVATFYSFFRTQKKGKHTVRVSTCVPCMMAGADKVIKEFEKELKITAGETSQDKKVTLELASCIGMCDQAPALLVNDELVGKVTPKKVKAIIKDLK